jgi:hypothetical protein
VTELSDIKVDDLDNNLAAGETQSDDQQRNSRGGSVLTTAAIAAGVSLVVALGTAGGLMATGIGKSKVATLDLSGIVEIEQMRMTALMMRKDTTEDERMRAMSRAKTFGASLTNAIAELQASCKCVIVTRNAVIGQADLDLTEEAKAKLGIAGIDLEQARASAEQAIDRRIPSAEEVTRRAKEMVNR